MTFDKSKLVVTPGSYREATNLKNALGLAINKSSLSIDVDLDKENIMNSDIGPETIGSIIKTILNLGISEEVERALFDCSKRATYNKEKVDEAFFEEIENRELFYPIMQRLSQ